MLIRKKDLEYKIKITTESPLDYVRKQVAGQQELLFCC
jgi:hypothetical protein